MCESQERKEIHRGTREEFIKIAKILSTMETLIRSELQEPENFYATGDEPVKLSRGFVQNATVLSKASAILTGRGSFTLKEILTKAQVDPCLFK